MCLMYDNSSLRDRVIPINEACGFFSVIRDNSSTDLSVVPSPDEKN